MSEGIAFNDDGVITVEFDQRTYTLRRPKFGEWRRLTRAWDTSRTEARFQLNHLNEKIADAQKKIDAAKSDAGREKAEKAYEALAEELHGFTVRPLYEWEIDWMRDVFKTLSDPLPDAEDDWPAWLAADPSLPVSILTHWQAHPKASGEPAPR